jgi:serine/threonine protein phosphatase PrpC
LITCDSYSESNSISYFHKENQDSFLCDVKNAVFAIADGVGGYLGGKEASILATNMISRSAGSFQDMDSLKKAFLEIHKEILSQARSLGYFGMGTTLSVAKILEVGGPIRQSARESNDLLEESRSTILAANVGDSPILLFERGSEEVAMLYHDDSEREQDPSNMWTLSQYLGFRELDESRVNSLSASYIKGDVLLLCSDGVTDNLVRTNGDFHYLRELIFKTRSARKIVESALRAGIKSDDITAVLVFLD